MLKCFFIAKNKIINSLKLNSHCFSFVIKYKKGGGIISVLEINVNAIKNNLINIKSKLNEGQKVCFVAKANCYGVGDTLCQYFDNEVDYFAVSSAKEFFSLKNFVTKPIIILDPIYDKSILKSLINLDCELTVSNLKNLEILLDIDTEINKNIMIHLALNTGMNRFGFSDIKDLKKCINKINKSKNIVIVGIFSHYFDARIKKNSNKQQLIFDFFKSVISKYYHDKFLAHICASEGSIFNNTGDMVRLGFGLYNDNMFETIKLKTNILEIQSLKKGDVAGYNAIFKANKKTKIAVIGIGYGDGIFRNILKNGYVLINDKMAKIVAVCMDSMLVDVSKISCKIGDEVIIIGKYKKNKISICDIAMWCDTIGYEIIVRLSNRIDRVYVGENKCRLLQENIEQEN